MKIILVICFSLFAKMCICQTQLEMNEQAQKAYLKTDKELNEVYGQILKEYSPDKNFIVSFKAAQRLWIQFRDAEVKCKFPDPQPYVAYGSMYPMCWSTEMRELTEQRIKKLRTYLKGAEEAEGCTGSIKWMH